MNDKNKNRKQLLLEIDELKNRISLLEKYEDECIKTKKKVEQLNVILEAIRGVDKIINKEKDRNRLLKKVCNSLIRCFGFYNAWIALFDHYGDFDAFVECGLNEAFLPMKGFLKRGEYTNCISKALSRPGVVIIKEPSYCSDCPLSSECDGRGAMVCQLTYNGIVYGLLSGSIPKKIISDVQIQRIFEEVAGDIAFALHNIKLANEHVLANEAVRKNEEKLENILHASPIPAFVVDTCHRVTYWNRSLEEATKIKAKNMIGKNQQWKAFYHEKRPCMVDFLIDGNIGDLKQWYNTDFWESDLIKGAYETITFFSKIGSSEGRWIYVTAAPLRDSTGKLIGAIETLQDITETKRAEKQIRSLSRQIIDIQERERELLSREIHDNVGQLLGALKMGLSRVKKKVPDELSFIKDQLGELLYLSNKTIMEIRELSHALHPPLIHDLGIISALEELCKEFRSYSDIVISWNFEDTKRPLESIVNITIYRLIQEGLNNILKHSKATKAHVSLTVSNNTLCFAIEDNGLGFLTEDVFSPLQKNRSLGLLSMQERIALIEGRLEIQSEPGKGTTIIAWIKRE